MGRLRARSENDADSSAASHCEPIPVISPFSLCAVFSANGNESLSVSSLLPSATVTSYSH